MLDTTSYAITPSKVNQSTLINYSIESIQSFKWDGEKLIGTLSKGTFLFYFINEKTMRFHVNPFGAPKMESTIAVIGDSSYMAGELTEDEGSISIEYGFAKVLINKHPFNLVVQRDEEVVFETSSPCVGYNSDKHVFFNINKKTSSPVYGLGEKSGFLDKNGSKISNWNTDVYAPHNKDTVELYQSIPFAILHQPKMPVGIFFDNSYRTEFDMQTSQDSVSIMGEGGKVNAYILLGTDLKEVVSLYTDLTGNTPLPPKWSLGYHQSRYSYTSQDEVKQIVNAFKKYDIPLDCVFLDIHYMDGYRVFTFDENQFPSYESLVKELHEQGVDVVPIVDPGVKKDVDYSVYREGISNNYFCKYIDGTIYHGEVWPGESAFPDFMNEDVQRWWGELHTFYTKIGIRGIWNDMNEPSVFNETKTMDVNVMHRMNGELITHREGHNLYGLYMSIATYNGLKKQMENTRPFSLTRAGYAGVQRYSAVWTGDNRSHWEHLEMSIPMILNLGLSGVAFTGADVGGFSSDTTPELLIRWNQVGAFLPYFRNHSVQDSIYQEPWVFGESALQSVKKYIEIRYQFLPYLYTLFYESEQTGVPVVRPLVMEYPEDENTFQCSDEFMLGSQVLIAPILRPGQTHRSVYLPKGIWYDFWNNEQYIGGQHHLISADLDTLPIYIKGGTILPLGSKVQNTKEKQSVKLHVYFDEKQQATGVLYEDDGTTYDYQEGHYNLSTFSMKKGEELITKQEGLLETETTFDQIVIAETTNDEMSDKNDN